MRKVAIFDIDGTVFRSSLLIELTDELVRDGVLPADAGQAYAKARSKWLDREGTYDDYINAVSGRSRGASRGWSTGSSWPWPSAS